MNSPLIRGLVAAAAMALILWFFFLPSASLHLTWTIAAIVIVCTIVAAVVEWHIAIFIAVGLIMIFFSRFSAPTPVPWLVPLGVGIIVGAAARGLLGLLPRH